MTFPISRFLNVHAAYFPSFSANGRFLSFISNMTGTAQAWQVAIDRLESSIPWPEQLTFAEDRVLSARYMPDNQLLYSHDVGGNENAQIFLLNLETGYERCLSEGYEAAMHTLGGNSPDGRFFLFSANRRHRARFDLYRQALVGGEAELLWPHEKTGYLRSMKFSPTGDKIIFKRIRSSFQYDLFLLNLNTKEVQQLNPIDEEAQYTGLTFSSDGRFLYTNTNLRTDFRHVARYDLQDSTWQPLITPNWDTNHVTLSPNGRYLAYVVNEASVSRLHLYDLDSVQDRTAPAPDNAPGVVGWYDEKLTFSPDSTRLAFSYTSAVRTSDIYVWDVDGGRVTAVTRSSHGGIPTNQFVTPALISYPSFDGRDIPAWYLLPTHFTQPANGFPVVVIVHGGPESQFRPYFNFLAQYLVHQGYAVLATNVRGSTGYGKAFTHLDDVERRMDSVADLAHSAYWLRKQPHINPDKIGVYGGSYGGFMVLAALTNYPELWAAAVNIVGISNFVTFLENTSDYRRAHREAEYGRLATDRDFLEQISPLNHVDNISAPLMVIHGANDPRVPLSEAKQLVEKLSKREVPVEFLVFEDEGHGIAKLKNKLALYPVIETFLKKHLG